MENTRNEISSSFPFFLSRARSSSELRDVIIRFIPWSFRSVSFAKQSTTKKKNPSIIELFVKWKMDEIII